MHLQATLSSHGGEGTFHQFAMKNAANVLEGASAGHQSVAPLYINVLRPTSHSKWVPSTDLCSQVRWW
jgi:hypothetical protein